MSIVISDTSPIRALSHLGLLDVLPKLFGRLFVPPEVAFELAGASGRSPPILVDAISYIEVVQLRDRTFAEELEAELDLGESEAIALAGELDADTILIDEMDGRTVARRLGLTTIGALGVLIRAKRAGLVVEIRPLIVDLRDGLGFFMSKSLEAEIMELAGEG